MLLHFQYFHVRRGCFSTLPNNPDSFLIVTTSEISNFNLINLISLLRRHNFVFHYLLYFIFWFTTHETLNTKIRKGFIFGIDIRRLWLACVAVDKSGKRRGSRRIDCHKTRQKQKRSFENGIENARKGRRVMYRENKYSQEIKIWKGWKPELSLWVGLVAGINRYQTTCLRNADPPKSLGWQKLCKFKVYSNVSSVITLFYRRRLFFVSHWLPP